MFSHTIRSIASGHDGTCLKTQGLGGRGRRTEISRPTWATWWVSGQHVTHNERLLKKRKMLDVVADAYKPSSHGAKEKKKNKTLPISRPVWTIQQVPSDPGLQNKTPSQNKTKSLYEALWKEINKFYLLKLRRGFSSGSELWRKEKRVFWQRYVRVQWGIKYKYFGLSGVCLRWQVDDKPKDPRGWGVT